MVNLGSSCPCEALQPTWPTKPGMIIFHYSFLFPLAFTYSLVDYFMFCVFTFGYVCILFQGQQKQGRYTATTATMMAAVRSHIVYKSVTFFNYGMFNKTILQKK